MFIITMPYQDIFAPSSLHVRVYYMRMYRCPCHPNLPQVEWMYISAYGVKQLIFIRSLSFDKESNLTVF